METEFKYTLKDFSTADKILKEQYAAGFGESDTLNEIKMHAVYFDTEEHDLSNRMIGYRIREENDKIIATVKWGGGVDNGLHSREEINLLIHDEKYIENPEIEIFESSNIYEQLREAVGDKKLVPIVDMEFLRRELRIDTGKSISVLSVDDGTIHGAGGDIPIQELEIEWYHGEEGDFKYMVCELAKKYNLVPENVSKLQRGLM